MSSNPHDTLVTDQFGPRAAAYVTSAVHAQGEDLRQLAEIVRGRPGARILDLGCGGGHVSFHAAPHASEVVAYDLSGEMLDAVMQEAARRGFSNITAQQGAVEALPFADGSFDMVLSRYTAHHWHDFAAGLREARRVLRAGGHAVFIDAVAPEAALLDTFMQTIELLRDPSHVRDYRVAEWRQALQEAGFAPGAPRMHRVRLDYAAWVERMRTPEIHRAAIRSLEARMSAEVVRHFAIEADGSFTIDTMLLEAAPA